MAKFHLFLLSLLAASYACDAFKVLLIFPMPSKSHSFLGKGIMRHLLKAGHEVTILTPYVDKNPPPNLHQVDTSSLQKMIDDYAHYVRLEEIMKSGMISVTNPLLATIMTRMMSVKVLEDENVKKFLSDKSQHFDLVIAEWIFNELLGSFAAVYDSPLIWFSSTEPDTTMLSIVDGYLNPSYNGMFITENPPFSFSQRLTQLWHTTQLMFMRETIMKWIQIRDYNYLVAPYIEARGRVAPSFTDIMYNASLVLGMSHVSMGTAVRLPQMYKHIGGFHISEKVEPMPENLKKILDNAKDGVIYFSMGSNLRSDSWPDSLKKEFVQMFGSLKQTVLWKFEDSMSDLPKNLHILQWAPQQSILAHPNCRLFVTHGGILSTTETIHAGKPIIGLPVLGDQFSNVLRAVGKGFAIKVDLSYNLVQELKAAIEEMISNPKYAQKAKELSYVYHHRPAKPGDEIVHWAEHVVNTKGAPHLRSPALLVPWYQKYYIDFVILVVIIIIVSKKVLKRLLPIVFPRRFGKKQKTKTN